jgi:CheY-like chemotaxis protein
VTTQPPIILIIDDERDLGRNLKRLTELAFRGYQVLWARNGVTGLDLVRAHAKHMRLIVLDIDMPLMDGNATAVQIRRLAPHVPVMPFTAHEESIPALIEMGCVLPVAKHPENLRRMPELMRQAMEAPVAPLPELPWITALLQSGNAVLSFVQQGQLAGILAADREAAARVQRALMWIEKYCGRYTTPAREVIQARKLLREAAVG